MQGSIAAHSVNEFQSDSTYIIVKAAPRASTKFGETVCIAGINHDGSWVRLYPVSFKDLSDAQKFKRWDRVSYRWRRPTGISDLRDESRRVDSQSISITGDLPTRERNHFLGRVAVDGLQSQREKGKSLALLKAEILDFIVKKKSEEDFKKEIAVREALKKQSDMFVRDVIIPREPCPFAFQYRYRDADGLHSGTCQDWETEATFFRRRAEMGEN